VKPQRIVLGDRAYPKALTNRLTNTAPQSLYALGDLEILGNHLIGLICSIQCPGSIVIKTFDVIRRFRDEKIVMIGGFHSPMERECLDLLLRGSQPVILCPARNLRNLRIGKVAREALAEGRLLVLSFFADEVRRTTSSQAIIRNDWVSSLSEAILVPHAAKNGKTWVSVRRAIDSDQKVFTFEDEANCDLISSGAKAYRNDQLDFLIQEIRPFRNGLI